LNVGSMTLSGVSGLSSATSALFANNLLTLQNVTLNAASINGSSIGGTDDDPSDGYYISVSGGSYSFVSPWSSVEGGFAYNANAINFTLNGSSLVDANADGAPDNVSVSITSVADVGTIMIIGGLGGEVSLNGQALGVSGDPSYTVGFIVDGEDFIADSFSNISGGSTVNVDNAVIYVDTEGTLTINDTPITVDNNGCELALTIADGSLSAVDNLNGLINGAGNASVAVNGLVTINGTVYWTDDPNGITVSGSTISGLDANSLLYVSPSGTYVVNSTTLEIGSDSAALGINNNLASTTTLADLRAAKVFALPDDTDFISADQVRETLNADGTDTFGGSDFDGNKIIELNAKTDIVTGDLIDSSGRKFIVIDGGGDQIVSLGGDGSNGVLVEAFADGEKIINAGDNGDTLINNSTAVDITLKGGAGNDSIIAAGGSRELIDVSNGGRDTIVASNGASIKGYDPSTGAAFLNPISTSSLMTAIDNGSLTFGNGTFSIEGNGETTIEGVVGSTTLNLVDNDGDTIRVMFGNRSNVTVGDDDASIDLLLYSDLSELTLLGGAGDDTIFAGENNVVDGGGGNDLLKLRAEGSGSDVVLSAGRDTVENFSGGWDSDTSDRLVLGSGRSTIDYSFSAGALHVSVDGSSMIIPSLKTDTATKIFTSTTVDGDPRRTLLLDGYSTYVATNDERADQYIGLGNRVGLNLSAQTTDETINLNGDDYQNIATITLGSGNNSLAGSNDDETIVAGLGRSTISSGDGNDVLVASTSDEKVSGSTFVYTNGLDTLRNFEAVGADSDTADEIVFNGRLTGVEIFGNDLVIEAGSVDQLTVVDGVNEKIKFNGFVFEVGDDMTCGEDVDAYVGLGDATLNVGSSGGNVWLNGVLGGIYSGIRVLDGSEATSDATLVGNELNNWIVGGSGNNSLWGGGSSNDTLNAGPGYNEYYYVYGDGEDVINNARDDDVIKLLGIGLEDIDQSEQRITGDAIVMRFNDGGSLTVYSRTDVQFEFKDGSRWSADRSSRSWYSRS
ncbi:MAG: hypothetical protein IJ668_07980, partial [Selenomonadaceae bacterium]|nr:hypothetical protein [Selenomonadaceae bacterium]